MFKIHATDTKTRARTGEVTTPHGTFPTPIFMPCATHGAVKTLSPEELDQAKVEILLGNTYHSYIRPGDEYIRERGGLHAFMHWDKPILTDSGGFQVFSLGGGKTKADKDGNKVNTGNLVKITEQGIEFRSHLDGSKHFFSPEKVVDIQANLDSDIMMVLDECAPYPCSHEYAQAAMDRTHRWAKQSAEHFAKLKSKNEKRKTMEATASPLLFGIVQGSTFEDLRKQSARTIADLPFDGIAIGGVSVGESKEEMYEQFQWVTDELYSHPELVEGLPPRPIYAMGIGTPEDILEGVEQGIDMFDCVLPTRLARHGSFWHLQDATLSEVEGSDEEKTKGSRSGTKHITNAQYRDDDRALMQGCDCYACEKDFSRAYIRHMFIENDPLAHRLMSLHNLRFLLRLTEEIRAAIKAGTFTEYKKNYLANWQK